LKIGAWAAAPAALAAGWFKAWRVAAKRNATVMHAHWVIPGGVTAMLAAGRTPLVVSLHGSDVFVAERHRAIGRLAGAVFKRARWVTACSEDLAGRAIGLGAPASRVETLPYGVDVDRFRPRRVERDEVRRELGLAEGPVVFSAGRLVSKKGFEFLIDAAAALRSEWPNLTVVIAGDGDLRGELEARAAASGGATRLIGNRPQDDVARIAAAADVVAVPSVHDEAGNVDGLPNFALEAMSTGTPVVATHVGGLPDAIENGVSGRLVPERDTAALGAAMAEILRNPELAARMGAAARGHVTRRFGWAHVAERLALAYDRSIE
jgi:glycosyltransferase involved in cell wall biosynthesis